MEIDIDYHTVEHATVPTSKGVGLFVYEIALRYVGTSVACFTIK